MLSQNQIKYVRSLAERKHRQMYHKFTAEGEKVVAEALAEWPQHVEAIYAVADKYEPLGFDAATKTDWIPVSNKDMERISSMHTPPGILAVIRMPGEETAPLRDISWHLYLDGISDPGNLGGILRTADWFGLRSVLCGPGTVEWSNPKVVQSAMGSLFRTKITAFNGELLKSSFPEHQLYGAALDGTPVASARWPSKGILLLGSESHGITPELMALLDQKLTIPKDPDSRTESLNVGVATGILLAAWAAR